MSCTPERNELFECAPYVVVAEPFKFITLLLSFEAFLLFEPPAFFLFDPLPDALRFYPIVAIFH